jgi:hypothetical protein
MSRYTRSTRKNEGSFGNEFQDMIDALPTISNKKNTKKGLEGSWAEDLLSSLTNKPPVHERNKTFLKKVQEIKRKAKKDLDKKRMTEKLRQKKARSALHKTKRGLKGGKRRTHRKH